jgi:hypothetical protein
MTPPFSLRSLLVLATLATGLTVPSAQSEDAPDTLAAPLAASPPAATPIAGEPQFPTAEGLDVHLLASATFRDYLGEAPATDAPCLANEWGIDRLGLLRTSLEPGATTLVRGPFEYGPMLTYIAEGNIEVTFESSSGLDSERSVAAGKSFTTAQQGMRITVENTATKPAVLLTLSLGNELVPAARSASSSLRLAMPPAHDIPRPEETPEPGVSWEILLIEGVTLVPNEPADLFLARSTWQPGATLDERVVGGLVGLVGESAALTVGGTQEGDLVPGADLLLLPGDYLRAGNEGSQVAEVLLVGAVHSGEEPLGAVDHPVTCFTPEF